MSTIRMSALDATDPLAFLAALGVLRIVAQSYPDSRLHWEKERRYVAILSARPTESLTDLLFNHLEIWRAGHAALDFAVDADRKVQDLKQPPDVFRELMHQLAGDAEGAEFVAAYATGVAVDGSGKQTKPTSFHFTAGQQRFLDVILNLRTEVTRADLDEAINGPWVGRQGPKDPRWRAGSERSRALLSFDPSKQKSTTVAGAAWLAFQALPLFPVVPVKRRAVTTGFTGRGRNEQFTWPVWSAPLNLTEARIAVGMNDVEKMSGRERTQRGLAMVLRSNVLRSAQGYGNFSASFPV